MPASAPASPVPDDLHVINGVVHTQSDGGRAWGFAVRDGKISAVLPSEAALQDRRAAEVIDLGGATVVPGFIETHAHPLWAGIQSSDCVLLPDTRDVDHAIAQIAAHAATRPAGDLIQVWQYDHTAMPKSRHLTRHDIDRASEEHPIVVRSVTGHLAYANSRRMEALGLTQDTPDPEGGRLVRDADGRPTGRFEGPSAVGMIADIVPCRSEAENRTAVALFSEEALAQGVTAVHELGAVDERWIAAYDAPELEIELTCYHYFQGFADTGYRQLPESSRHRCIGVKFAADGSFMAETACVHTPYESDPANSGVAIISPEDLRREVVAAHKAGWQVAIHANGDRGIDFALDAIAAALAEQPREDHRHRLEHVQLMSAAQAERAAALGVHVSVLLNALHLWADWEVGSLGPDRAERLCPLRTMLDAGLQVALHSDVPVTPLSPLSSIRTAVTRRTRRGSRFGADQGLTVDEALAGYTSTAARFAFDEGRRGRIADGLEADFVVLDRPLDGAELERGVPEVSQTWARGELRYTR